MSVLGSSSIIGTGFRYDLLQQYGKMVQTKAQKVLNSDTYF